MNLALFFYYVYIAFFAFITYYIIAWVYVKIGRYIFDYLIVPAFFPFVFFNWLYIKRNKELNPDKNHIAIILCNSYMPERILAYREDIPKLIKHFKKNNWAYNVYFRVSKKDFNKIINNPKTTILYILGHGQRHGVKINNKEMAYYCEFEKSPKKKFVVQLHCNHYSGKSLVEYISEDSVKGFVTNNKISGFGVSKFINKVIKENLHGAP